MKLHLLFFFFLLFTAAEAQQIVRAEYFIDKDPSPGKGVSINFEKKDSLNLNDIAIATTGFPEGAHTLGFRVQDAAGRWSAVAVAPFGIIKNGRATFTPNTSKIITAEYFIDKDPSAGKGIPIVFPKGDFVDVKNISVPTTGLADGSHLLGFRIRDSLGYWSMPSVAPFSVIINGNATFVPNVSKLITAEYFIDKDPSTGKGIPIFFPKGDSIDIKNISVPTTGLIEGPHLLGLRVRDSLGYWSTTFVSPFSIMKGFVVDTAQKKLLKSGEYFFGKDPGPGKGIAFSGLPAAAESWNVPSLNIVLADTLPLGANTVTFRLQQDNRLWSPNQTIPFDICLNVPAKPTVTSATICGGTGTAKLIASGAATKQYSWFNASYGGTLIRTSAVGDSSFTTPTLTKDSTFWVAQKTSACNSSRTRANVTVVQALVTPSTQNITRCGKGVVTLSATGAPAGGTYRWYSADTSKLWLAEGPIYKTDTLFLSRSYAVSTVSNGGKCESPLRKNMAVLIKTCSPQTITFPFVNDLIFGIDSYILLKATASSGLKVQYELISGPARLNNDTVYPTSIGEVTIRAKQPGDANFEEAVSVIKRFKVVATGTTLLIDFAKPVCTGDALKLSATAIRNGKYNWTGPNGFTSTEINPVRNNIAFPDSGKYTLTVSSPSDTFTAFVNVPVFKSPDKVSLYAVLTSKCDKEVKVFAGGDSIVSFQWFYNAKKLIGYTSTTYTPNFTGVYSVTGFNLEGCPTSSTPIYVDVNPDSIPVITRVKNPERIRSTPSVNYQWFVNNYFIVGSNSREIPLIYNGTYNVLVTDKNNCEKFSYDFSVNDDDLYTLSRASIIGNTVNLEDYNSKIVETVPVPANNSTKISWASPERGELKLKVFSAAGMEHALYHLDKSTEKFTYEFDTSTWKDGLYLLNITCGEKSIVGKITVVH